MKAGRCLDDELAILMQQALLPSRFPVRRDIEVEARVRPDARYISFYDHIWLQPQIFAAIAVRVNRQGLEGAECGVSLHQLIRALLAKLANPVSVMEWLKANRQEARFDAAIVSVDVATGAIASASHGLSSIAVNGQACRALPLASGDIVWLTAGDIGTLAEAKAPGWSLDDLVGPAVEQSEGGGAGCAVLYKSPARSATGVTLVMTNEQAGIPALLDDMGQFFTRQSLPEEAVAGLDVALDEILTNSVNYGFKDGNRHEILIELSVEPGRLIIEVRDDGAPFDPLSLPEPDLSVDLEHRQIGGLGIHFVRTLLDKVAYQRRKGWNVLTLEKQLPVGRGD